MSINEYLASIRRAVERLDVYGFAESIVFHEEIRAGKQAIIKAEIVLVDGSCLIIREYIGSILAFWWLQGDPVSPTEECADRL